MGRGKGEEGEREGEMEGEREGEREKEGGGGIERKTEGGEGEGEGERRGEVVREVMIDHAGRTKAENQR